MAVADISTPVIGKVRNPFAHRQWHPVQVVIRTCCRDHNTPRQDLVKISPNFILDERICTDDPCEFGRLSVKFL